MASTLTMNFGILAAPKMQTQTRTDQAAYETLVAQCWDALWRYAYRTTGNRDDAEDLLSEDDKSKLKQLREQQAKLQKQLTL